MEPRCFTVAGIAHVFHKQSWPDEGKFVCWNNNLIELFSCVYSFQLMPCTQYLRPMGNFSVITNQKVTIAFNVRIVGKYYFR